MLFALYFTGWFALLAVAALVLGRRVAGPPEWVGPLPRVSILVAARNEQATIGRCLRAIRALRYPPELVEVLVGNDGSTDTTAAAAEMAMRGYAGAFRVLDIRDNLGSARGKANVLAQLARAATADFFFITDADIAVPATWLTGLLAWTGPTTSLITGLTLVVGPRLFHRLQGLDWLLSLGLVQVVTDLGQPVTAMGNNMLVTRAAYEATGGYEALPFSVTEDFELFRAVRARGYGYRNLFRPDILAESLPIYSWRGLLHQRRRWLRGVEQLPRWLRGCLGLYGSFYLVLAVLALGVGPAPALAVWAAKMMGQGVLTAVCFRRMGRRPPLELLPLFELYALALTGSLVLFRLLPLPFEWKGRRYR